jgi:hypothetical protein
MTDRGAHFYRTDFQVHTPRDINWDGANCVTDDDRSAYAKTLVSACREKGLKAIAITDHHDMAFAEYVRKAAADEADAEGNALPEDQKLIVFPGMELTLGVPCQALLIFDADFPGDLFSLVTTALALDVAPSANAKTAETKRLDHIDSMSKLKVELDKHAYLRDRYIVFPNVTNEGKFSILRDGFPAKYAEMPCVGGYIDGPVTKLKPGNKSKVDGRDKAWGHKRIACYQTSDNRDFKHKILGTSSSWVKWAVPTAEALRQACLAQESRVLHEQPLLPPVLVRSINVSNSAFLGPIDLALNPQYNALIGGRGTGKSSILEYLRWALCDQPPAVAGEDAPNYQDRRIRLIDATLKPFAATVEVRFEIHGVPHLVRRKSADGSVLIKVDGGELRPCTEEEVRSLLPIQAYSQKQLSSVSVRVDELLRFITSPIRAALGRLDARLEDQASQIRQSFAARQRRKTLQQAITSRDLEEGSLTSQASAIRASLGGLSEGDRKLLDQGRVYDAATRAVDRFRSNITSVDSGVAPIIQQIDGLLLLSANILEAPENELFEQSRLQYENFLQDAKTALQELRDKAILITAPYENLDPDSPFTAWNTKRATFKVEYDAAVHRSSAQSAQMQELQQVETRLREHIGETNRIRADFDTLAGAEEKYGTARAEWFASLKQRDDLLDAQCKKLTTGSGETIRAQVKRFADTRPFEDVLRQSLTGSKIAGAKIEEIAAAIRNAENPAATWASTLNELELLADFDPERDGAENRPEAPTLKGIFTAGELDRLSRSFKPEHWLTLSLSAIKSTPIFEHKSREEEYIPFQDASAGQQATALLKVLLNEPGPPLIIDQPEEDLDNPVMLEIVKQVWAAKQQRQIIFASHNANLVVNGDAELVVWCEHRIFGEQSRGHIAGQGAIDIPNVREAIKSIMEGGEAAFRLRREKYGF